MAWVIVWSFILLPVVFHIDSALLRRLFFWVSSMSNKHLGGYFNSMTVYIKPKLPSHLDDIFELGGEGAGEHNSLFIIDFVQNANSDYIIVLLKFTGLGEGVKGYCAQSSYIFCDSLDCHCLRDFPALST